MIQEHLNVDKKLAVTSDRWHVIHAKWSGVPGIPRFVRTIVSEHEDSAAAVSAARALKASLVSGMGKRPPEARDQVIVRRPRSESLKNDKRLVRRPK